jgi:hypothetical protein
MTNLRLVSLALVIPSGAMLVPSRALAFGFGVEGGGTLTLASGTNSFGGLKSDLWSANGGIIIENNFPIADLFLNPWADVQTPVALNAGETVTQYVPIDLGLRLGLNLGLLRPYLGVLGQVSLIAPRSGPLDGRNSPLWGFGGDLGLDIAVAILRFGIELRGVETLTPIETDPVLGSFGSVFEIEALASVRLSL